MFEYTLLYCIVPITNIVNYSYNTNRLTSSLLVVSDIAADDDTGNGFLPATGEVCFCGRVYDDCLLLLLLLLLYSLCRDLLLLLELAGLIPVVLRVCPW